MKKILMASVGTAGDFAPVHLIAKKLRAAGHLVEFALEDGLADLCSSFRVRKFSRQTKEYYQEKVRTIGEILDPDERANYFVNNLLAPFWAEYEENLQAWKQDFTLILCNGLLNSLAESLNKKRDGAIFAVWYCGPDPEYYRRRDWQNSNLPRILAYSSALSDDIIMNCNIDSNIVKTGFWTESEPRDIQPDFDIFVSLGSNNRSIPLNLTAVLNIFAKQGKKIVIQTDKHLENLNSRIQTLSGYANHDYYIEASKATVHQAGSGIVSKTLRLGKPSIVFPFWGDQYSWAELLIRKKLAAGIFNPWSNEQKILEAMSSCLTPSATTLNCQKISPILLAENGLKNGVDFISNLLNQSPE